MLSSDSTAPCSNLDADAGSRGAEQGTQAMLEAGLEPGRNEEMYSSPGCGITREEKVRRRASHENSKNTSLAAYS